MKKIYLFLSLSLLSLNLFAQSISLPFVEDFESGQNGWTAGGTNNTWTFGTPSKLGLSSAPSGSNAWVLGGLTGSHNNNEDSFVQSPEYDFTALTNAKVSATVAYNLEACCDGVTLQYSIDAGSNWTTVNASNNSINWYDDEWNGSTNGTRVVSSNVSELAGESSVIFRFYFDSDGSVIRDGFVFDDFTLSEFPEEDLSTISLDLLSGRYFSNNEEVSAVVYNGGSNATSSFDLSFEIDGGTVITETFNVAIPQFSYDTLTFSTRADLSDEKDYTFRIWSGLGLDANNENDTISTTISHLVVESPNLPYEIGFETYFGESGESSVPAISNYPDFELLLEEEGVYQRLYSRNSISLKGDRILSMDSYSNTQYLIGHFDLASLDAASDNLILSFLANSDGNISVEFRSDSASSWLSLDQINTGIVQPYSYNLSDILVNNSENFSKSTQFRFTNPPNSRFNLDAFRLELVGENDLLPLSQNLLNGRYLGNSEPLTFSILNKGINAQQNFDVFYQIDGGTVVQETVTASIAGLDTVDYTFSTGLDLSTIGTYSIDVWTGLSGDSDQSNDTLSFSIENTTNPVVSLPYVIDFDNSSNLFKRGDTVLFGDNRRFDFFTNRQFGEVQTVTGSNAIQGKSLGVASATQDTNELILNLNLSNYTVASNKILLNFDFKDLGDFDDVEDKVFIRGSESDSWITLFDWNGSDHYSTINAVMNISDSLLANGHEFSNTTQIKFGQAGNGTLGSQGLVIDNLSFTELLTDDISIIKTDLRSSRTLSSSEALTVNIENKGVNEQQSFDVFYQIDNGSVVQESVTTTLAALDTLNYTFATTLDLSNFKEYDIKVWTELNGDMDQSNDTLSLTIENVANPVVQTPLLIDFENDSPFFREGDTTLFGSERRLDFFTENGTGQVQLITSSTAIDNKSLGIASSSQDNNAFLLNLNLSQYTVADNKLLFSFDFKDMGDEDDPEDKVFVRGSENDPWITLYDWNTTNTSNITVSASVNISDSLQVNGQEFGSSTQIKFGQSDNVELNADGLILDNLSLTEFLADDVSIVGWNSNTIESSRNLSDEALSIDIYNTGFNSQQNFDVFYQINGGTEIKETVTSTISSLDTLTYTFASLLDLSSVGSYDIVVWTSLTGDMNQTNDTLSISIEKYPNPAVSLPLAIDFENDSTFFNEGDTIVFGEEGRLDFFTENGAGQVQVFTGTNAITNKSLGIASSSQDNNALILNLNLAAYAVADNKLLFGFDYKDIGDEDDAADKVFVRGSEDDPWITIYDWNNNDSYTTVTTSVNISDSLQVNGQEFSSSTQIKFGQSDNLPLTNSDGLVIDNLSLTELLSDDIGVVSSPLRSSGLLTSADTLKASLYNYGIAAQQGFDVYYQIDGEQPVKEVVSETLNSLDSLHYTFDNLVDLSEEKSYSVKIWTSLTNDGETGNDTLVIDIDHYPLVEFPYAEYFNSNDGNWQAGGTNSSWEYGVPNKFEYDTVQNNKAWVLGGLMGSYNNSEQSYLESPLFTLSNLDSGYFSVDLIYDIESGFDELRVQYSTDQGTTWNDLTTGVSNWFSGAGWTGTGANKITGVADVSHLSAYEEVKLRFYFDSDGSVVNEGAIVDNIKIEEYTRTDLRPVTTNLKSSRSLTETESVMTQIYNNGINTQQNFDVFYQVNNGAVVQETVPATLAGLDTLSYTFNTQVDLSNEGMYSIEVWTGLNADEDTSNDTLSISIEKYPNPAVSLPLAIDFENDSTFFNEGDTIVFGAEGRLDFFTENGTGQVQVFTGTNAITNKSLGIASSSQDNNALILNLNLAAYAVADNKLLFGFDYKDIGDEDDAADKVFVRGSEDDPWITIYDWNNNDSYTTVTASVNISDSLQVNGQEFSSSTQIKFGQSDNLPLTNSDGLVIDNLSLVELLNDDIGVVSSPLRSSGLLTSADTLKASLYNYGIAAQQGFDVYYQIDGEQPVKEVVSETLNSLDSLHYTFDNLVDLSEEKSYSVKIWTSLTNDGETGNDTLVIDIDHYPLVEFPYAEYFNSNDGNWQAGGTNSSWEYGVPNKFEYDTVQNNKAWVLGGLMGSYNNSEQSYLESPLFTLSNLDSGYFSVDLIYDIESGFDELRVQYSTDQGTTWNDLTTGVSNWFSGAGWTGTGANKITGIADISHLSAYEEVKLRFYFDSDGSVVNEGAIVDNIKIEEYTRTDLSPVTTNLKSSRSLTETESVITQIYNNGINAQQNFDVFYQVNNGAVVQETVPSTVAGLDTLSYTFNTQVDLSNEGVYSINVWTGLNADEDTSNDTLSISIEKYPNPAVSLPLTVDFENDSTFFNEGDTVLFGDEGRLDFFTENGTGQVQVFTGTNAITSKSLGIASSSQDNNALILNLNLGAYAVADNKLLFGFDYKDIGDEDDAADKVFVRGSEDDPWITIYDWNNNDSYTTTTASVNISDSLQVNGQEFSSSTQIKFGQSDNLPLTNSDGLVIDNISLIEMNRDDVGVLSSPIATQSGSFSNAENLSVEIYNYGYDAQQGFDIFYQIDNGPVVRESVTETINTKDTINYTFSNKMDLSVEKVYKVTVWTELLNDGDKENDTLSIDLEHYPVLDVPYAEDFESGSGAWISGGINSSWEFGIPNKLGYDSANSNNAWALGGLDSVYNNNEQSYIESPVFNLSILDSGYIALDIIHDLEQGWDKMRVQYSTDLGTNWNDLTTGLYNWYSEDGWTGTSSNEIAMMADISHLTSYDELKFRIYFDSDESGIQSGAIVDNIEISTYEGSDLILTDYSIASLVDTPGSEESIEVSVFNKGEILNGAVIEYSLNDQQVYQDTVSILNPFEIQTITLSNTLDFTMQCTNQLRISLIVENDVDQSNNVLEETIYTNTNPIENLIIEDSIKVCSNEGILQLESEINNGTWSGTGVSESGSFNPEIAGVGVHEILFETYEEGCRNFDLLLIEVEEIISGTIEKSVEGQLTAPEASSYNWFKDGVVLNKTSQTIELESSGNYSVELTNEAGCISILEAGQVLSTTNDLNSSFYKVYPNPAKEYLMIKVSSELSNVKAQLYSFEGKLLWESVLINEEQRLDLNNSFSGTYILKLISNEGVATEKIIIF